ncbi:MULTISPECIES: ABC transporter ATP-binding protein [unclassified Leifsonia]|uniref:ABC transporter ATP-binding protein n=1 Tax=unclassified Leifsonia TaxID=2663824 RepID=UPI0006FBDC75|nr:MULTISPECIES: ABC transporter ATP-binding protein [unclassified Leifsonia]KQX05258.1 spermidine/putrescine ABC transporter ATP-binding protein [Leifsonia sp. Root1293]KRA08891.1 spermidine/putrescine ABC transporter ATP-binding protein [Leifsonia sp. Root60]
MSTTPASAASIATADNLLIAGRGEGASVTFDSVVKDYGSTRVLHGVDLAIEPGEFVSLLGPSGCGKTTALRVLAGLEQSNGGRVLIDGTDVSRVPTNHRDIGMVFQSYSLFPHLTVLGNVMFGLRMRRVARAEARRRGRDSLALVGLGHLADRYPHQLSGGQQQRVALARALVTEPRVLLLDEPLSALDAKVRVQLRDEIRRIQLRLGITTVFVTHDQEEALAVSDRIAVMDAGGIEQVGTPEELYLRPASPVVAAFVGLSSVVPGTVMGDRVHAVGTDLPLTRAHADGPVEVFIRPESVSLTGSDGVPATVQESTFLGSLRRTLLLTADGVPLRMQHAAEQRLEFGQHVHVSVSPSPVAVRELRQAAAGPVTSV